MPTVVKHDALVAVVEDSKVAGSEADTGRIDMMSQTTLGRRERAEWDRGIRNRRCRTRDDHPLGDDPGMDVRKMSGVGERLQDGNIRRYGDVCDSLDLWDEELVGAAHGRRRPDLDKDLSGKASRNRVEVEGDSWDPAPGASGPEVGHAHRRLLPVDLAECRLVDYHAGEAWPHCCGDEGMRCGPERTLAPGKRRE